MKYKNLKSSTILLSLFVSGCAGNSIHYSSETFSKSDLTFIGIPTVLGVGYTGTTFPITPHYSLTAKHVSKYTLNSVLANHPDCDITIIKKNNTDIKEFPYIADFKNDAKLTNYGYSGYTLLPLKSEGYFVTKTFIDNNYSNNKCQMMLSNVGAQGGMSGGPVYEGKNLVGINIAYMKNVHEIGSGKPVFDKDGKKAEGLAFIPLISLKDWLIENISKTEDAEMLKFKDFHKDEAEYIPLFN